jgi:non-specific protein-tyrosine kinase
MGDVVDLHGYLRLFRRRWRLVLIAVLAGLGVALTANLVTPAAYRAQVEVFVSLREGAPSVSSAYQGNLFSQDRVKSYAQIVDSAVVTGPVLRSLDLDLTPAQLGSRISASVPTGTVLIDIAVVDGSPERARDLANAVANQFGRVVRELEANGARQSPPVSITVVRPATLPGRPVSPRRSLNIGLGLLTGLALGAAAGVLREVLDTSVKTSEDLCALTGSAALGEIDFDPDVPNQPLVSGQDPQSKRIEAFRVLRTNLRYLDVDNPPRAVVFTSSVVAEGKSTTVCNLGITLSAAGVRVVLLEGDLRRPSIAEYMGLEGSVGLTDVLVGRSRLDDVLQPWGDVPLSVLPSGEIPPNPSELLGSAQMATLLAELRERADLVLVDAPPLLPVTDAAVLSCACDGAVLVVRYGRTTREQVSRSIAALHNVDARVLGTVLSMVPGRERGRYGYGGGYYYGPSTRGRPGSNAGPGELRRPELPNLTEHRRRDTRVS